MSKSASIAIISLPAINCLHCCSTVSIIAMIVFAMLNANQSICSCHWGLAGCSQANIRAPEYKLETNSRGRSLSGSSNNYACLKYAQRVAILDCVWLCAKTA